MTITLLFRQLALYIVLISLMAKDTKSQIHPLLNSVFTYFTSDIHREPEKNYCIISALDQFIYAYLK